jgi:Zn-dependent protease
VNFDSIVRVLNLSWPVFRAFRVTVRVGWTVVLWLALVVVTFAKWLPFPQALGWGAAWTLALYVTTWTHEMGHIAMGRRCGVETDTMTLRALGGLAHMNAPAQTPQDEMKIALAGPATHLAWLAVLWPTTRLVEAGNAHALWFSMLVGFLHLQFWMMAFNLLPIWPMDGGRTLRAALSTRTHATRASYHVATIGFVGNAAFVVVGLLAWLEIADVFAWGPYGFLLAWIGLEGINACRQLRLEAKYGDVYGDHDPFQKTLLASQAAMRDLDVEERTARRASHDRRRQLQETADRLLDRINELGGIDRLSARERRQLEEASRELAEGG